MGWELVLPILLQWMTVIGFVRNIERLNVKLGGKEELIVVVYTCYFQLICFVRES